MIICLSMCEEVTFCSTFKQFIKTITFWISTNLEELTHTHTHIVQKTCLIVVLNIFICVQNVPLNIQSRQTFPVLNYHRKTSIVRICILKVCREHISVCHMFVISEIFWWELKKWLLWGCDLTKQTNFTLKLMVGWLVGVMAYQTL